MPGKPQPLKFVLLGEVFVKGMTLSDAVKQMRGTPDTPITLTIARKGEDKPLVFTLKRAVIKIQSVRSKLLEPGSAPSVNLTKSHGVASTPGCVPFRYAR